MTVEELFDHIHFLPDRIVYFDKTNNVEDTVEIGVQTVTGEKIILHDSYYEFLAEYKNREVMDWDLWFYGDFKVDVSFK